MTALSEYQRLECQGLWRDQTDGQKRAVIVSFGDATLVISDLRNNRALAHWSLPAVQRRNPGAMPAIYSPGADAEEELEIDDSAMIAAVAKVHAIILARQPHPGRLRFFLFAAMSALVAGLGLFWLPGALVNHTAAALPYAKRQEVAHMVLADIARVSGAACVSPEGAASLALLRDRLLGSGSGELVVLPAGLTGSAHLPGDVILLGRSLLEDQDAPEVAAGHILAEDLRAEAADPMVDILDYAGTRATFRLLTSGTLDAAAVAGYGEVLLVRAPAPVAAQDLLRRFETEGVRSAPYAYAIDPSGETTLELVEADALIETPGPVLEDTDWVALQGICGE